MSENDAWGFRAEMYGWRDMPAPFPPPDGMTLRWRERTGDDSVAVAADKHAADGRLFRQHMVLSREFVRTPHCPAHIEAEVDLSIREAREMET